MSDNKFVVLEGIDGSGTSTQLEKLSSYCKEKNINSHFTSEPTSSLIGLTIREFLKGKSKIAKSALPYLFLADRINHLDGEDGIIHHLNQDRYVFCDRYLFSTLAYQSLDFNIDLLYNQNKNFLLPSRVIFIDTPVAVADSRITSRDKEREIYEKAQLQHQIRENYFKAFELFKNEIKLLVIDGEKSIDAIFTKIINFLELENEISN